VDRSVRAYLAAGVPAAKLGIGIGFYGSCWTGGVSAPRREPNGSHVTADDNTMSYTNIMARYADPGALHFDEMDRANVPYLGYAAPHGPQGCTFVSYEDERSIGDKGRYVLDHGLGGVIIWTINQGYLPTAPEGRRDPLLDALWSSLQKK